MKLPYFMFCILFCSCHNFDNNPTVQFSEGGYNYPSKDSIKDSFWNSTMAEMDFPDSISFASSEEVILKYFQEPNLSLAPLSRNVFRLRTYHGGGYTALYSIYPTEIIAKYTFDAEFGCPYDSTKLSDMESKQLTFLSNRQRQLRLKTKSRYVDSMLKTFPELSSPAYYINLLKKSHSSKIVSSYKTYRKEISKSLYKKLIDNINNSQYWQLPLNLNCDASNIADGEFIILEANTEKKYNIVMAERGCLPDSNLFAQACDAIIKSVNLYPHE